jgi:hypothetical protein
MVLKIVAFKGKIKTFLNTLAVHIEGAYFSHFFSVSVPLGASAV